jgi:hypothetical protein
MHKRGITLLGALFIDERKLLKEMSSTTILIFEKGESYYERVGICTTMSQQLKTMQAPVHISSSNIIIVKHWQHLDVQTQ